MILFHLLANGDVIVTLLPANTKWPWITPAIFRPELVPEELMAQGLTVSITLQLFRLYKFQLPNNKHNPLTAAHRRGVCQRHGDLGQRLPLHRLQHLL